MKRIYNVVVRFAAWFAAAALLSPLFISCSRKNSEPVMSFRGEEISVGMFSYMMASQKAYVRDVFESYTADYFAVHGNYPYGTNDFDEFLKTEMPSGGGLTYAQNAFDTVADTAKLFVVVNYFCGKYNLRVTDKSVISDIEATMSEDMATAGGRAMLDEILAPYGAETETEKEYLYNMARVDLLYDYLYGDRGTQRLADSVVSDKFYNDYRKIDFIYYPYYTYDTTTGDKRKYEDEVIAGMNSKAEDLYEKLSNGEYTFTNFADHDDYAKYDEGLCYTDGVLEADFQSAADAIEKPGELCKVISDDGFYIIRLLEAGETDLQAYYDDIYTELAKTAYYDYIESYYSEVSADARKLAEYDFAEFTALDLSK